MATLTVQVPDETAPALAELDGVSVDEYTLGIIARDVLYEIQDEVHRLAEDAPQPPAAEVRALADRLAGCADLLKALEAREARVHGTVA
ncbi:MAG: hypothetical protein QOE38_985 [Thermoleophilaceae bacterium]|jgi:hypothetical protein|nr:hypothetical protein [Thermoleophilaceae bacterium]